MALIKFQTTPAELNSELIKKTNEFNADSEKFAKDTALSFMTLIASGFDREELLDIIRKITDEWNNDMRDVFVEACENDDNLVGSLAFDDELVRKAGFDSADSMSNADKIKYLKQLPAEHIVMGVLELETMKIKGESNNNENN